MKEIIEMLQQSGHYTAFVWCLAGLGLGIAMIVAAILMPRVDCGEEDDGEEE